MKKAIIGAGGFAREVFYGMTLEDQRVTEFFVNDEYATEGFSRPLSELDFNEYEILVAIGDPVVRKKVVESLPPEAKFFTFISEDARIFDTSIIGRGCAICAGTVITVDVIIEDHVHLNLNTTIGHDSVISKFTTVSPGVNVSGNVYVGENCYLGTNSSIRESIQICDDVTIGLNSGVVKNIDVSGTYVGLPAKVISYK